VTDKVTDLNTGTDGVGKVVTVFVSDSRPCTVRRLCVPKSSPRNVALSCVINIYQARLLCCFFAQELAHTCAFTDRPGCRRLADYEDINRARQAAEISREAGIASLKHTRGDVLRSLHNELASWRLDTGLLDHVVWEYAAFRRVLLCVLA